ncbi:head-tail connector protein [Pullulanibacillus sp. KACC 23026]|uniref:head-tail connector protein n=1 Tax=Pullulanibacillus sp. KACC 23026 TaxID=3028315 RepID=UPI0023B01E06|nr:head-tail connector protein [Pullulanibacillus sp. KACC 23026]WEG14150.1 head-tail connector protein [Pullulanibacillus sp. KACC 23026]
MDYKIVDQSAEEPIDLDIVKEHLKVEFDDEDTLITSLIAASRELCEAKTWRSLKTQKYEMSLGHFHDTIRIPKPPLVSIDLISYKTKDGTETIIDPSQYIAGLDSEPGVLKAVDQWPKFDPYPVQPIKIQFTAGYDKDSLPKSIQQAQLLLIGHFYANRQAVYLGTTSAPLTMAVDALLSPFKVRSVYP